jgi:hypothetical protein
MAPPLKGKSLTLHPRYTHFFYDKAHQAVDRRLARKDAAQLLEHGRDHLARPGHTDEKKLWQGRRDKDQNRRLAVPEKAARGLTHKTGGEHERHREQRQIRNPA